LESIERPTLAEDALLTVRDLAVHYRIGQELVPAFEELNLMVPPASIVGLSGNSGSGKTTLAKTILRLLPRSATVDSGSIRFAGVELLRLGEAEMVGYRGRRIGMIFQEPAAALNPLMKLGRQLCEPLKVHYRLTRQEAERRLFEVLEAVGIDDAVPRLQMYPHEVSTGQLQRALLAAAVACRPELLICDEPLAAVDPPNRRRTLDLLESLRERYRFSILLISHDLQILNHVCDQVVSMPEGCGSKVAGGLG